MELISRVAALDLEIGAEQVPFSRIRIRECLLYATVRRVEEVDLAGRGNTAYGPPRGTGEKTIRGNPRDLEPEHVAGDGIVVSRVLEDLQVYIAAVRKVNNPDGTIVVRITGRRAAMEV